MALRLGDRQSLPEPDVRPAGVGHLQKEFAALLVGHRLDVAVLALRPQPLTGVERVLQRIGQQHAQVRLRHRQELGHLRPDPQGDAAVLRPLGEGGQYQVHRLVLAEPAHLLGLDLGTDLTDIGLRPLRLSVFNAAGQKLHVMPQVVAVGAGLPVGFPQAGNFPRGLGHLQPQALLYLLQPASLRVLGGGAQHEHQIQHAAHGRHKLHRRRQPPLQHIGVDPRQIVKGVADGGHDAEEELHRRLQPSDLPHGGREEFQQHPQQRQRHDQLHRALQITAAVEAGHGQQRDPPPYLTAQIRRQYRHDGPYRPPLHHAQHDHQRYVGHQRVDRPQQPHVGDVVHHALDQQDHRHAAPVAGQPLPRPVQVAEGGGQDHAENAHHRVVQQIYGIPQRLVGQHRRSVHHKNTCFRLNTCSRYRSLISENLPWGMGISARHAICRPR